MNAPTNPTIPLLDLDLLKTLAAIADGGSFSAAADLVHRTPSAVSMQVKRIEELLGRPVFVRDSRSVTLTPDGAFLLEHARRMLALNRDALARFITPDVEGVVRLGSPDDVAERHLPFMLRRFAESHPCVTVNAVVESTVSMVEAVKQGALDLTLVTCDGLIAEAAEVEVLMREPLVWGMLKGGLAPEQHPLPLSVWNETCIWRKLGIEALDTVHREWRVAFQSAHIAGQRAAILADLAVAPIPASSLGGNIVEVPAKHGLPPLPKYALGLLIGPDPSPAVRAAADHLRASFATA